MTSKLRLRITSLVSRGGKKRRQGPGAAVQSYTPALCFSCQIVKSLHFTWDFMLMYLETGEGDGNAEIE